jgi:glycosyltransferase involved in cell wall biosynthesis
MAFLIGIPVFNEEDHVQPVIEEITCCVRDILVVDDGSTDATPAILKSMQETIEGLRVLTHPVNQGYGKSLIDAFDYAIRNDYEYLITLDCDEQHEPMEIADFVMAVDGADIVSGSRYHPDSRCEGIPPPEDRRRIGREIVARVNKVTGYNLTDAFCGFKAYTVAALRKLHLTEHGYGMPIELWMQAWKAGLTVTEKPVTLKYLDSERTFGGELDNGDTRRRYYHAIIDRALATK